MMEENLLLNKWHYKPECIHSIQEDKAWRHTEITHSHLQNFQAGRRHPAGSSLCPTGRSWYPTTHKNKRGRKSTMGPPERFTGTKHLILRVSDDRHCKHCSTPNKPAQIAFICERCSALTFTFLVASKPTKQPRHNAHKEGCNKAVNNLLKLFGNDF